MLEANSEALKLYFETIGILSHAWPLGMKSIPGYEIAWLINAKKIH